MQSRFPFRSESSGKQKYLLQYQTREVTATYPYQLSFGYNVGGRPIIDPVSSTAASISNFDPFTPA